MSPPSARRGPAGPRSDHPAAKRVDHRHGTADALTADHDAEASIRVPGRSTHEWRVTYRRLGWVQDKGRIFQREAGARALVARLTAKTKAARQWAPLAELILERRPVPVRWELVDQVVAPPPRQTEPIETWEVTW